MNNNDLYRSFSEVDDETLLRTELHLPTRNAHARIRLLAASLAFALLILGFSFFINRSDSDGGTSPRFVITARAEDGEVAELGLNDGCFNSGGTGETMFQVDAPLFSFVVKPADWEKQPEYYTNVSIVVSYAGQVVDSIDDHVLVAHLIPVPGSGAPYEYEITGWFEEDTDITITISDNQDGSLIEKLTVHVSYVEQSAAYQLTVTDIQTSSEN